MHTTIRFFTLAFFFSLAFSTVTFAAEAPSGFIAMADVEMTWADAQNFCQQQGGNLPRPDNRDAMENRKSSVRSIKHIDGFGEIDWQKPQKWPANLPDGEYWLGTVASGESSVWWFIEGKQGMPKIFVNTTPHVRAIGHNPSITKRVVCVPQ